MIEIIAQSAPFVKNLSEIFISGNARSCMHIADAAPSFSVPQKFFPEKCDASHLFAVVISEGQNTQPNMIVSNIMKIKLITG